mgnify:CR=1 FL=1
MSRITKEEIEKTKCGRFLLSDENLYAFELQIRFYFVMTGFPSPSKSGVKPAPYPAEIKR